MTDPKHEVITENTAETDQMIMIPADVLIHTTSYHEILGSESKTHQKNILTSGHTYLSDLIKCLDVIQDRTTKKLTLTITLDRFDEPKLITKRYLVDHKEYSGRTGIK